MEGGRGGKCWCEREMQQNDRSGRVESSRSGEMRLMLCGADANVSIGGANTARLMQMLKGVCQDAVGLIRETQPKMHIRALTRAKEQELLVARLKVMTLKGGGEDSYQKTNLSPLLLTV